LAHGHGSTRGRGRFELRAGHAFGWAGILLILLCCACTADEVVVLSRFDLHVPGRPSQPIVIPVHLDRALPAHETEYQLEARVSLPAGMRGRELTFAVPHLYANTQLNVNGQDMVELDPEPTRVHRSRGTPRFRIPAAQTGQSALNVLFRVQHTWTQSGWLDTPFRISESVAGDSLTTFTERFNRQGAWLSLATIFVAGLLGLLIFLLDRRQVAFAWFALEAFFGSTMPLFQTGIAIHLCGVYDTALMAIGVTMALWASVRFTHLQFGLGAPHRLLEILFVLTIALVLSAPGPFAATQRAALPVIAFISVNVIYQIVITARLWSHEVHGFQARVLALSWGVLGILAGADQLAWVGFGELFGGVRPAPLGIATIALLQMAVLSHDYVRTLRHAERLNLELADRVRALEGKDLENSALNEALRRQISARSKQLAHAIVRLGATRAEVSGDLPLGSILENRYRIVSVLGRGGMGTVYEVTRIVDHKTFALKVLTGRGGSMEMARFAREAQLVAQLQHPNVVSIVDVDVAADGLLFIVLEFVRGKTLREHMPRGKNEFGFALEVLAQLAEGLSSIHDSRIVHRDLKPDNILVVEDTQARGVRVKITDFGVSTVADAGSDSRAKLADSLLPVAQRITDFTAPVKLESVPLVTGQQDTTVDEGPPDLTKVGMLIGTPRYMAPEALEVVSCAMDIFAFGVLAFELLSGHGPFLEPQVILRHQGRPLWPVPSLCEYAPAVPREIAALVERCLSEFPEQRPDARELSAALRSEATSTLPGR